MADNSVSKTGYVPVSAESVPQEAVAVPDTAVRRYYDYSLVFVIVILSCFGLMMVYSSSYYTASIDPDCGYDGAYFLKSQVWKTGLGFIIMLIVSKIDYRFWMKHGFPYLAYIASVGIMLLTDTHIMGVQRNGAWRWFGIGNTPLFQSAELVKVGIIVFFAFALTRLKNRIEKLSVFIGYLVIAAVPVLLILRENMSSAIIVAIIPFGMIFCSCRKKLRFVVILGAVAAVAILAIMYLDNIVELGLLDEYQASRIKVWQDPTQYSKNGGYQVLQGLYAVGSGGFFGKGLGNGMQKLGFIPEAQNDMIFSIICEETGVFGAICLMLLYGYMFYRFLIIARNAPDNAGYFIVVGIFLHISIQVILNIAVVANVIPNTGISLPFVSYGGTSVVFLMIEMGLVLSVANRIELKE